MLKGGAAGLVVLALGVAPGFAAPVSGLYAGIYAGATSPADVDFSFSTINGLFSGPGVLEQPTSFVNNGLDPLFFDFLNTAVTHYPFANFGTASGTIIDGRLDLIDALEVGAVVGYGFGNGLRIEADLSAASFGAGDLTPQSGVFQSTEGDIDGAGVWTWDNVFEFTLPDPQPPPFPLSDFALDYKLDVQFLLLNGFFDVDTGTVISPYLGGGLGVARITGTLVDTCACAGPDNTFATSVIAPAAQLGAGVRIALSDPVSLDLGYRYKMAVTQGISSSEVFEGPGGFFSGFAAGQSGLIGIHALQAGLTVAVQ